MVNVQLTNREKEVCEYIIEKFLEDCSMFVYGSYHHKDPQELRSQNDLLSNIIIYLKEFSDDDEISNYENIFNELCDKLVFDSYVQFDSPEDILLEFLAQYPEKVQEIYPYNQLDKIKNMIAQGYLDSFYAYPFDYIDNSFKEEIFDILFKKKNFNVLLLPEFLNSSTENLANFCDFSFRKILPKNRKYFNNHLNLAYQKHFEDNLNTELFKKDASLLKKVIGEALNLQNHNLMNHLSSFISFHPNIDWNEVIIDFLLDTKTYNMNEKTMTKDFGECLLFKNTILDSSIIKKYFDLPLIKDIVFYNKEMKNKELTKREKNLYYYYKNDTIKNLENITQCFLDNMKLRNNKFKDLCNRLNITGSTTHEMDEDTYKKFLENFYLSLDMMDISTSNRPKIKI